MKAKLFLPLLAVVFAVAGALATPILVQSGWYDSNGPAAGGGIQAPIADPAGDTPVCSISATNFQCRIMVDDVLVPAYNTKANAEAANPAGLLRYN